MRLSQLQKYILTQALVNNGKLEQRKIFRYYQGEKNTPNKKDQLTIITKSFQRLINQGLMVGYGRRTAKKWFFSYFKLTANGRKKAYEIIKQKQGRLIFKNKKI